MTDSSIQSKMITPYDSHAVKEISIRDFGQEVSKTLIHQHQNTPYKKGNEFTPFAQPWMLIILLIGFSCIAYVKAAHNKRFLMLARTLINWKVAKQIIRFEKVYSHPVNLILNFVFLIATPLFFSLSYVIKINSEVNYFNLFSLILLPILVYLIGKLIVYKYSAWLFSEQEAIEEYVFQANLFNKLLGIIFLILSTFILYSTFSENTFITVGLIATLILSSIQLIRGAIIGIEYNKNLFMIILYLCTLEILPWLVLIKLVNNSL